MVGEDCHGVHLAGVRWYSKDAGAIGEMLREGGGGGATGGEIIKGFGCRGNKTAFRVVMADC